MTPQPPATVLPADEWRRAAADHAARVDALTAAHRHRAGRGRRHPVQDFLFSYYSLRPGQLRAWHPGIGVGLADAADRAGWRFHRADGDTVWVDRAALLVARGKQIGFVHRLLSATAQRPGRFGCFGLHEWAMVYRRRADEIRHADWPLRLGAHGTDEVVRRSAISCTHYDAYRFFTEPARPLNAHRPTIEAREHLEQPGCLHVGMDLYKWAYKLLPAVSGELLFDCFELAWRIREVDMRASPYDLSELGYRPIAVETTAGKAEYVALQRGFAAEAAPLRERLFAVTTRLLQG